MSMCLSGRDGTAYVFFVQLHTVDPYRVLAWRSKRGTHYWRSVHCSILYWNRLGPGPKLRKDSPRQNLVFGIRIACSCSWIFYRPNSMLGCPQCQRHIPENNPEIAVPWCHAAHKSRKMLCGDQILHSNRGIQDGFVLKSRTEWIRADAHMDESLRMLCMRAAAKRR